jgi:hypothetical protein
VELVAWRERRRAESLTLANAKRKAKAHLKKLVHRKEVDVVALLEGKLPEWEEALTITGITQLLFQVPRIGNLTIEELVTDLPGRSELTKIGDMTLGERKHLATLVGYVLGDYEEGFYE